MKINDLAVLFESALCVLKAYEKTLPVMTAYMNSLGITDEWNEHCVAADSLKEALVPFGVIDSDFPKTSANSHTLAGFKHSYELEFGRKPTEQEIWNHAISANNELK